MEMSPIHWPLLPATDSKSMAAKIKKYTDSKLLLSTMLLCFLSLSGGEHKWLKLKFCMYHL